MTIEMVEAICFTVVVVSFFATIVILFIASLKA